MTKNNFFQFILFFGFWCGWWFVASIVGALYGADSTRPEWVVYAVTFAVGVIPIEVVFLVGRMKGKSLFSNHKKTILFILSFILPPILNYI